MVCAINIILILVILVVLKITLISIFFYSDIRAVQKRDPAAVGGLAAAALHCRGDFLSRGRVRHEYQFADGDH